MGSGCAGPTRIAGAGTHRTETAHRHSRHRNHRRRRPAARPARFRRGSRADAFRLAQCGAVVPLLPRSMAADVRPHRLDRQSSRIDGHAALGRLRPGGSGLVLRSAVGSHTAISLYAQRPDRYQPEAGHPRPRRPRRALRVSGMVGRAARTPEHRHRRVVRHPIARSHIATRHRADADGLRRRRPFPGGMAPAR